MEKELLYWSRWNYAVASFCQETLVREDPFLSLVEIFTGEGAEWIGCPAISYMIQKASITEETCDTLKNKIEELQHLFQIEVANGQNFKLQHNQLQSHYHDQIWRLQENIAELQAELKRKEEHKALSIAVSESSEGISVNKMDGSANVVTPTAIATTSITMDSKEGGKLLSPPRAVRQLNLMKLSEVMLLQNITSKMNPRNEKENVIQDNSRRDHLLFYANEE